MQRLKPATTIARCCSRRRSCAASPSVRAFHRLVASSSSQASLHQGPEQSTSKAASSLATTSSKIGTVRNLSTSSRNSAQSTSSKGPNVGDMEKVPVVKAGSNHGARILTLNKPNALNALDKEMIGIMQPLLERWEASPSCNLVILKGEGRAFCAGGDVKAIVKSAQDPATRQETIDFFKDEYTLDRFIALMKKPVISFLDGATMGGGVGISVHAPFRIATEKTIFSMPETDIGLFPDVGANFFLARLDGQLGTYLGLTGMQLRGYDVFRAGIATHFVPSDRLEALEDRLAALDFAAEAPSTSQAGMQLIDSCIEEFVADSEAVQSSPSAYTGAIRAAIDVCFGNPRVSMIVSSLEQVKEDVPQLAEWADETINKLHFVSPTSLAIALEVIRAGSKLDINQAFEQDFQLACVFANPDIAPDFVAGVTQRLLGPKEQRTERAPWSPASISDIDQDRIRKTFFTAKKGAPSLPPLPKDAKVYKQYPHASFALPSEELIGRVVKGDVKDSGSFAVDKSEVQAWFEREWNGKSGVREKVEEVLARRTETMEDGTLQWK